VTIENMSIGIRYILFATLAFAVMNAMAKELSNFHPLQVVFFRAFGTWIFIFPYMVSRDIPIKGKHVKPLLARGLLGVFSLVCFFIAVQQSTTIISSIGGWCICYDQIPE